MVRHQFTCPPMPVPQQLKAELARRRISNKAFAVALGRSEHHCSRVANGYVAPSPRFRADAARFLGFPEEKLFRETGSPLQWCRICGTSFGAEDCMVCARSRGANGGAKR